MTSRAPRARESTFAELKRYVGFTEADTAALVSARSVVEPHFARIAQDFYDRTREHEDAHAVFTSEEQITRLQKSLVTWLTRVFGGPHDDDAFEKTLAIGRVHAHVNLPQRYVLTAMALVRLELAQLVTQGMGAAAAPAVAAMHKALDLELAGMLEAYHSDFMARLESRERQASEALHRTEHRYVNAVELANVMVVGVGAEGRILLFNREAERVTGYVREEVMGFLFSETLAETDEQVAQIVAKILAGRAEGNVAFESALRTRTGKLRDVRWQLAHQPSPEDEVALFAIGTDVTDERALAERHRQQEKLAAVGTLAAGLAHEIRNPLNGAQLHIAFLERALKKGAAGAAGVDMLEAVHVVGDEIKRLAGLVSEFLDFARPQPLVWKTTGARSLCERTAQLVALQAEGAHAELSLDLPPREIEFSADGPKLEQVLLNLTQNAIEAVHAHGGGKVVLRVRQKPRDVLFEVEDDGPGLATSDAPIFDAFYSTKPQGTGLGLSISHRIVTDHGGEISVETKPGRTLFRFTIPLVGGVSEPVIG